MSGERRREQLLQVTEAIVSEQGFHAVNIEAVARRAGVTRPVVYGHFGDLDHLLAALVDREEGRAIAQLTAILPTVADAAGAGDRSALLLGALRGYLDAVREDPVTWRLVLMPPEGAPAMLRERIARGRSAVVAHLAGLVGPGFAPGRATPDPEMTARTLSALADEAARLILTDPEHFSVERILDHARWLLEQLAGGR
jgi:AcrR family transcriptional regulator